MNVRTVRLRNLFSHVDTEVRLPDRGLVVVRGGNGAGKSSLVEAVAVALWGKTLRGSPGWVDGAESACVAGVRLDDVEVTRSRSRGGKTALVWAREGVPSPPYESVTKAQEALEVAVGSFDAWRRTSALSSADVAHFSLATDAERKRLLEEVLGIDRFDGALEACRADLRRAQADALRLEGLGRNARLAVDAADHRAADARAVLAELPAGAPPPDPGALQDESTRLDRLRTAATREVTALRARLRAADASGGELAGVSRAARQLCDRLAADACPACGQAIAPVVRAAARARAEDAAHALARAQSEAESAQVDASAALADAEQDLDRLARRAERVRLDLSVARDAVATAERHARARAAAERATREAGEARLEAERAAAQADVDLAVAAARVAVLGASERVLGVRGVRAHLLGQALAGIEAVASSWLGRLGLPLALRLTPSTAKKDGGSVDTIGLEVVGAGGGHGYRGASGGERRRVDVALLLALAEVAAGARGEAPGTLFLDEVFDALDADGVDAASDALADAARTRCVVVVTHRDDLARRLPAALSLRVDAGRVVAS